MAGSGRRQVESYRPLSRSVMAALDPEPVVEIDQRARLLQTIAVIGVASARPAEPANIAAVRWLRLVRRNLPYVHAQPKAVMGRS